ncbi:hypothetical protein C3L33_12082, partial [Rhododendron williamsianum]
MDIDLRLPSGEHDKEEEEPNGIVNMLDANDKLRNGDEGNGSMVDFGDELNIGDGRDMNSPAADMVFKEDTNLEPLSDMEFESHGDAYSFYQEYARSMGFNTAIQNSRRSKTSREFIDAKFACSRYGTKREYEKSQNRQRSRQGNKQEAENSTGRRSCTKTDCKACMHVKRRPDGKWIIHRFEKEHNHELLPAQAVSEQTRKMYAAMARQFAEYKNVVDTWNRQPVLKSPSPFEKHVSGLYTHAVFKKFQTEEKLTARPVTLDGYFSPQQSMQGMVQLNLMAPTRDNYYGTQQTIQGLGQLNSIAPNHDGYYNPQPTLHGLGQMDFFRTQAGFTYGIREDPNLRPAQLHDDASRRA